MVNWDERYDDAEYAHGTEPNSFLVSLIDRIPKGDVPCLCEGEGRNGVYLAQVEYGTGAVVQVVGRKPA